MNINELHVVIGAGVAGCITAIMKKKAGYNVVILEKNISADKGVYPVGTETSNIVSENHSGAEYPFDPQSARDCFDGRLDNEKFFPEFIYGGKTQSRIIASQSMIDDGQDIAAQCRSNMEIIREQYRKRINENLSNYVFGNPDQVCREMDSLPGVEDVAAAFVTPQRGFNTLYVSLALENELRELGIEFVEGAEVTDLIKNSDKYTVTYRKDGQEELLTADQISICTAAYGFQLAAKINPDIQLPKIVLALREIIYVNLPDGTEKNFTCLKLEDKYGGMLSPLGPDCALVYHPPSAHIEYQELDTTTKHYPADYRRYLQEGHPEFEQRAEDSLRYVKRFYPELSDSKVLKSHLKVAINTTHDSRQRRNMGVFKVDDGCTLMILPKWTMCVSDAKKDLVRAVTHSLNSKNLTEEQAKAVFETVEKYRLEVPEQWYRDKSSFRERAVQHAINMDVPLDIVNGL